eukprot:6213340-Pleurochrysis_carterae.AAC.1
MCPDDAEYSWQSRQQPLVPISTSQPCDWLCLERTVLERPVAVRRGAAVAAFGSLNIAANTPPGLDSSAEREVRFGMQLGLAVHGLQGWDLPAAAEPQRMP